MAIEKRHKKVVRDRVLHYVVRRVSRDGAMGHL
jgi:hypothetical protein